MGLFKNIGSELGGAAGDVLGGWLGFKHGGKVPGAKGKARKAIVHGGETILPVGVKPTVAQKKAIRMRGGKV
jgi:hypothetical protein